MQWATVTTCTFSPFLTSTTNLRVVGLLFPNVGYHYYIIDESDCSEDGDEEENTFAFNLAAYIKPIGAPSGPLTASQTGILICSLLELSSNDYY